MRDLKSMDRSQKINIWLFNHPLVGVSDQIEFLITAFMQNGYSVTVNDFPDTEALNIVIENFFEKERDILLEFHNSTGKRVGVVMTEHVDFESGQIYIHGRRLGAENDYMHPDTQIRRLQCLLGARSCVRAFFTLGDLPELRKISSIMAGVDVRRIPFPFMDKVDNSSDTPNFDFGFSGFSTSYREKILRMLRQGGVSLDCSLAEKTFDLLPVEERDRRIRDSRLVLNVPQDNSWRWLSTMRIIAALRNGRATVSMGSFDKCEISDCVFVQGVEAGQCWTNNLKEFSENWMIMYLQAYERYNEMAGRFEKEHPFPHDLIEYWSITDRIHL